MISQELALPGTSFTEPGDDREAWLVGNGFRRVGMVTHRDAVSSRVAGDA